MARKVKIPSKVYVKFQERGSRVLGFMTPYDENEHKHAFEARKSTVDNWARDNEAFVGKNEEMEGFKVLSCVRRRRTRNVVWRVADPRGFDLEISSENLEYLLKNCALEKGGLVLGTLVWGRTGSGQNYLLVKGTSLYDQAWERTELISKRVSLRDVNRGDKVVLITGYSWKRAVTYLGGMYALEWPLAYRAQAAGAKVEFNIKRRYYFLTSAGKLDSKSSLKVRAIEDTAEKPLTKAEAEKIVNDKHDGRHPDRTVILYRASKFTVDDIEMRLEPADGDLDFKNKTYVADLAGYGTRDAYLALDRPGSTVRVVPFNKGSFLKNKVFDPKFRKEARGWSRSFKTLAVTGLTHAEVDQLSWCELKLRIGDDEYPLPVSY